MSEFMNASLIIQLHVIAAVAAFLVGPIALIRKWRDIFIKSRVTYLWWGL